MLLNDVKTALGLSGDEFNSTVNDLIESAKADMGITDIDVDTLVDDNPLFKRAIITYCRMNFSVFGVPDGYDRLKASYDEQKAQMLMASGYTDWGEL